MATSFAPSSSQSLLSSYLSASAERISLSSRPLTPGTEEKGVSDMQSESLNSQLQCMRLDPSTISPCGSPGHKPLSPDLATSSATACSYQTMEQAYDRDTWRMYERIQSARPSHEQRISFIEDTVQSVNLNDFDDDDEDRPFAEADNESEGIFEFDF
jgi:hypothetical protein